MSEKGFAEGVQKALNLTGLEGFQIMSEKDYLKRQYLTVPSALLINILEIFVKRDVIASVGL